MALLNSSDADLMAQLTSRYAAIAAKGADRGPATTKRLEDMLIAVREVNTEVYQRLASEATGALVDRAEAERDFAAGAARKAGVSFDAKLPDANFLKTLVTTSPIPVDEHGGSMLDPWVQGMDDNRMRRLESAIKKGLSQGEKIDDLTKRVEGILNISRKSAQTFALTANATVANAARLETFKAMKTIGYVEWSSILDSRTSPICQSLSGKVFSLDQPHPTPPAHPRCRSLLIPRRDNTGDAKHKPFGKWLKDQPEDVQNEVLGKGRADILRKNPNIDFSELFRKDGSYKTLDELKAFDKALLSDKPTLVTVVDSPASRIFSPINREVRADTIKVEPRRKVIQELNGELTKAKVDSRYDPKPEFRGIKDTDFGKAALSTAFTDEAASMINALYPEVDAITDAFNVPRLRAIRTGNGSFVATMGDGTLTLNPTYFNGYAAEVGGAAEESAAAKLIRDRDALVEQLKSLRTDLDGARERLRSVSSEDREAAQHDYLDKAKAFNDLRDKWLKLDKQVMKAKRTDSAGSRPVSTWKPGDDPKNRPYTATDYFSSIDRARQVIYHEMAHHVHQMTGKVGRRAIVGVPPVEQKLKRLFFNKFHGAAPGNLGGAGIERRNLVLSTYGTTNEAEWFAENFSAYMMGRLDFVEPEIKDLIEELLENASGRA